MLWQDEAYVNAYLNFYRQYVEHSMHLIKDHGMWRVGGLLFCCASPFSLFVLAGRWSALATACRCCRPAFCIKLTAHLTNAAIKRPWLATFNRRCP
jgi:hypothetical protein